MDQKKKNIILFSALGIVVAGLAAFLMFRPGGILNQKKISEDSEDPFAQQKEAIFSAADDIKELQRALLSGKRFRGTTSDSNKIVKFEFRSDGSFKGYTSAEKDDLGSWDLEAQETGTFLVIDTINVNERYLIGYNNNKDITLTNDKKTYVLTEEE